METLLTIIASVFLVIFILNFIGNKIPNAKVVRSELLFKRAHSNLINNNLREMELDILELNHLQKTEKKVAEWWSRDEVLKSYKLEIYALEEAMKKLHSTSQENIVLQNLLSSVLPTEPQAKAAWEPSERNKEIDQIAVQIWEQFDADYSKDGEAKATDNLVERVSTTLIKFVQNNDRQAYERFQMCLDVQARQRTKPNRFNAFLACHSAIENRLS